MTLWWGTNNITQKITGPQKNKTKTKTLKLWGILIHWVQTWLLLFLRKWRPIFHRGRWTDSELETIMRPKLVSSESQSVISRNVSKTGSSGTKRKAIIAVFHPNWGSAVYLWHLGQKEWKPGSDRQCFSKGKKIKKSCLSLARGQMSKKASNNKRDPRM